MQELDIMLRRAKLKALVYRTMAKRIAGLVVPCSEDDRLFAEQVITKEVDKLLELAGIHDPQQSLLSADDY